VKSNLPIKCNYVIKYNYKIKYSYTIKYSYSLKTRFNSHFQLNQLVSSPLKLQSGQILPLSIVGLTLIALLTLNLFNRTQTHNEKIKSANIADAAAFSGVTFQARALNYTAYTNRAMIANQVSIGQLVSMSSWIEYGSDFGTRIGSVLSFIPYINVLGRILVQASQQLKKAVNIVPPIISGITIANQALNASQRAVLLASKVDSPLIINKVIQSYDSNYQLSTLGKTWLVANTAQWGLFTDYQNSSSALQEKAQLINQSRDQWSSSRNINIAPPSANTGLAEFKIFYEKSGEARLSYINNSWRWSSKDAGSVFFEIDPLIGSTKTIQLAPMGESHHVLTQSRNSRNQNIPARSYNSSNQWFSRRQLNRNTYFRTRNIQAHYTGVQGYNELRTDAEGNKKTSLTTNIEIEQINSQDNLNTAMAADTPSQVKAVSQARVFFQRPTQRQDGTIEYANLFNPYWVGRLSNPNAIRATSWIQSGVGALSQ